METAVYRSDFFDRMDAQAEAKGEARLLLKILKSRGIALTDEQFDQVTTCTEPTKLDLWADRALDGLSADDIFREKE
jgi:hypothetical protein